MKRTNDHRTGKNNWAVFDALTNHVIVLSEGERWCVKCGESIFQGEVCPRCCGRRWVDPTTVLRPEEYCVAK
jgi:hypothetical protein